MKKKKFLDTKRDFGYKCLKLGFKTQYKNPNDGINFITQISRGEGGYWDDICFNESLKHFSGKQISSIQELSDEVYYCTPLEEIKIIFNREDLTNNFKRVLFKFMTNHYHSDQTQEYKILQKSLKKLLS